GGSAEIILDRHRLEGLNFPVGIKGKISLETFQNTLASGKSTTQLRLDLRWYKKLHTKILWATRVFGSSSFGPSSVNYSLGGTENWLASKRAENITIDPNYAYSFNALANGVRGFPTHIRSGGNVLFINTEIRIPLSSYFGPAPVNIGFFRTLQWIAFFDAGSAWNGVNPFSNQHYNTRVIDQGAILIIAKNVNNPFVSGFGSGLRCRLFGYYVRGDMAWGMENGVLNNEGKPSYYFSIGFDF
ncbi:MAG: hypothetical protein LPK45_10020, partial [Bacteroidota bacterium]|nr:hypothetical protein [Bacteroidota bacterium]MDX5431428.1 hypothetical protein [Bacteroidota bacterium]MDX5470156.1 hypothetical protein [Bacteroidota bacterium]